MPSALFLQSAIQDPYKLYESMLNENPVYWDEGNQLWAIYSYQACVSILNNAAAHIPPVNQNNKDGLNEYALLISGQLARLSNNIEHDIARQVAMLLFNQLKTISIKEIVEKLLQNNNHTTEIDWVSAIGKKLPVMVVLKSFGFNDADTDFISERIDSLVKIMLPNKTSEQVRKINEISKEIYSITEKYLLATGMHTAVIKSLTEKYSIEPEKILIGCVSSRPLKMS